MLLFFQCFYGLKATKFDSNCNMYFRCHYWWSLGMYERVQWQIKEWRWLWYGFAPLPFVWNSRWKDLQWIWFSCNHEWAWPSPSGSSGQWNKASTKIVKRVPRNPHRFLQESTSDSHGIIPGILLEFPPWIFLENSWNSFGILIKFSVSSLWNSTIICL